MIRLASGTTMKNSTTSTLALDVVRKRTHSGNGVQGWHLNVHYSPVFSTDPGGFFAVQPCSLGVPVHRRRRWNERKSARPDVTTGHFLLLQLALKSTAFGKNPHSHVGIGRWGSEIPSPPPPPNGGYPPWIPRGSARLVGPHVAQRGLTTPPPPR
eukprot:gene12680-biopygen434